MLIPLPTEVRGVGVYNAPPPVPASEHVALHPADTSLRLTSRPVSYPEFDDLTVEERDLERADGWASRYWEDFILGTCPDHGDDVIATEDGTAHFGCGELLVFDSDASNGTDHALERK